MSALAFAWVDGLLFGLGVGWIAAVVTVRIIDRLERGRAARTFD